MRDKTLQNGLEQTHEKNKKTTRLLLLIVVGMFGFGFAMVPLYRLVCNVAGIGISGAANSGRIIDKSGHPRSIDKERLVTIQFDSLINEGLQWEFHPLVKEMKVHPGKPYEVSYYAKNNSGKKVVAQAIPGITPWQATSYFHKTECFCFTQQTLDSGEEKDMPLKFIIDPDLPKDIKVVTLSYTFMDTDRSSLRKKRELNLPSDNKHKG